MPLKDLTFFLPGQGMKEGPQLAANLAIQLPPSSVGHEHHGRLALPTGMRHALLIVVPCLLLWLPHQAHLRRITPASVKPLQVALVDPVAYPSAQLTFNYISLKPLLLSILAVSRRFSNIM
jgi:hypothetical protein